jgi:hypothetical protein
MPPEEDPIRSTPTQEIVMGEPPASPYETLIGYIPAQEKAIHNLSIHPAKPLHSLNSDILQWSEIRASVWGKGLEFFQQEEDIERGKHDPIEDAHILPDTLPSSRSVITPHRMVSKIWNLSSKKILVRSEYHETAQAALLANEDNRGVFVVTGQPGIGLPLLSPSSAGSNEYNI